MIKSTFDRFLTVVFHAVAICTVTIATLAGASLIQPDATSASPAMAQQGPAPARSM